MDVLGRYRNLIVLVGVLFAQVLGLAIQVKRTTDNESTRLIRIWAVDMVTPLEKALVWTQTSSGNIWHNYFYLRGVRAENRSLKAQIERMSLEQVRMSQDADQARRLQALFAFKEQFISQTMAAQVIGTSGSELSRSVYIDKGEQGRHQARHGGHHRGRHCGQSAARVPRTSQVLLIDDQTSGVGAILDKTRLQGILRGTPSGEVVLEKVMSDETVPAGEMVLTSGGDGIFPKGLLVGRVTKVSPGSELFLNIRVRPAADLSKLEEVLVVTKIDEKQAEPDQTGPARAIDILAERLPGVPSKPENAVKSDAPGPIAPGIVHARVLPLQRLPPSDCRTIQPWFDQQAKNRIRRKPPPQAARPPREKRRSSPPTTQPASGASSGNKTAGTPATKVSPKPVKPAGEPKPQPAAEDSPH